MKHDTLAHYRRQVRSYRAELYSRWFAYGIVALCAVTVVGLTSIAAHLLSALAMLVAG